MKKNFLRITLLSLFMLFAGNNLSAQSQHAEKLSLLITREMSFLNMTPEQARQVFLKNYEAIAALENLEEKYYTQNTATEQNAQSFINILKSRNSELKEILSPAQFKLFQENKIERAAIFRTALMAEMLDLSDDQLPKVFEINKKVVENVRQDLDLYFNAKNDRAKNKAQRKLHKAMKKTDKDFDKVLSPQQAVAFHNAADYLRSILREDYGAKN